MEKNILCFLIDDDTDDQEFFSIALSEIDENIRCITADDGIKALEKISADPSFIPDFIFLDLNMPRMGGMECLIEIKKILRLAKVPVIIYTTSVEQYHKEETKKLGAADFLSKPADIKDLTITLRKLFVEKEKSYPSEVSHF